MENYKTIFYQIGITILVLSLYKKIKKNKKKKIKRKNKKKKKKFKNFLMKRLSLITSSIYQVSNNKYDNFGKILYLNGLLMVNISFGMAAT